VTTPVDPTIPQTVSLAGVDELVSQAKRLGLTWGLRPGAVTDISSLGAAYNPRVQMDGDPLNIALPTVSLIGGLALGMRVMVMSVPPLGNYLVGVINPTTTQRYEIGALSTHGTTITTTETVLETFSQFNALGGAAYRVEIDGSLLAGTAVFTRFRLRKTNTAGQSLNSSDQWPGIGLGQAPFRHVGYFRNTGNGTLTYNLVLTALTGSSTSQWYADAETPRYVSIQYAGPAVEFPSAVVIT
jgi:hypothetical protein